MSVELAMSTTTLPESMLNSFNQNCTLDPCQNKMNTTLGYVGSVDTLIAATTPKSTSQSKANHGVSFELDKSIVHNYDMNDIIRTYSLTKPLDSLFVHYLFSFTFIPTAEETNALNQPRPQYVSMFAQTASMSIGMSNSFDTMAESLDEKPEIQVVSKKQRLICKVKMGVQKCEYMDSVDIEYSLQNSGYVQKVQALLVSGPGAPPRASSSSTGNLSEDIESQPISIKKSHESQYKAHLSVGNIVEEETSSNAPRVREYEFVIDLGPQSGLIEAIERMMEKEGTAVNSLMNSMNDDTKKSTSTSSLVLPQEPMPMTSDTKHIQWDGCLSFKVPKFRQNFNVLVTGSAKTNDQPQWTDTPKTSTTRRSRTGSILKCPVQAFAADVPRPESPRPTTLDLLQSNASKSIPSPRAERNKPKNKPASTLMFMPTYDDMDDRDYSYKKASPSSEPMATPPVISLTRPEEAKLPDPVDNVVKVKIDSQSVVKNSSNKYKYSKYDKEEEMRMDDDMNSTSSMFYMYSSYSTNYDYKKK